MDHTAHAAAGGSSAQESRTRKAAWLAESGTRVRRRVAPAVLAGGALSWTVLSSLGWSSWLLTPTAALVVFITGGIALAVAGTPTDLTDLDVQARAERVAVAAHEPLQRTGFRLLADRTLPEQGG